MMNIIAKSFEMFVAEPLSVLRKAIIQVVGVEDNSGYKSIDIERTKEKIQINVINSKKAYKFLTTVAYKRNLNKTKGLKIENKTSKILN